MHIALADIQRIRINDVKKSATNILYWVTEEYNLQTKNWSVRYTSEQSKL